MKFNNEVISHGVKMTAMPAWELTEPDKDIQDLVAFVKQLPNITPAQYQTMRAQKLKAPGAPNR
jgi:hypothetical protein